MRDDSIWINKALHDLCQPLTALQCRLFLATMVEGRAGEGEMEQAVTDALKQCDRAIGLVRGMQQRMHDNQGVQV